jgi:hypothetical protein
MNPSAAGLWLEDSAAEESNMQNKKFLFWEAYTEAARRAIREPKGWLMSCKRLKRPSNLLQRPHEPI